MSSIQADLEAVGITVTQNTTEWATYLNNLSTGQFQLARLGWTADYPTMDNLPVPELLQHRGQQLRPVQQPRCRRRHAGRPSDQRRGGA